MFVGNLGDVRYNFQEIFAAAHINPTASQLEKLCPVELYIHLSPNCLPPAGNVNCRPWLNGFFHNDFTRYPWIKAIQWALDNTHKLFHEYQKRLFEEDLPKLEIYLRELSRAKSGHNVDEIQYKEARENIQNFWISTHFFLKSIHAHPNVRMRQIFEKHFCQECFYHMEPLEQMQSIIALQGELGASLPLKALIEASFGQEVLDDSLLNFVKKLKSKDVPFNILHYALKAIVEYAAKYKMTQDDIREKNYPTLDRLEQALDELDPSLFFCRSQEHLAWRNTLKKGSEITTIQYADLRGEQAAIRYRFILGEQIEPKPESDGFDNNMYFAIQDCYISKKIFRPEEKQELKYEPLIQFEEALEEKDTEIGQNCVLWISINEAIPGIRRMKACDYYDKYLSEYGFQVSQIQFIDNQGRFALVEKLHENQAGIIKVIPELIQTALKEVDGAPQSLEPLRLPQKFLFDKDKCLKSIKLIKPAKDFSFNSWEQLVYDMAKGSTKAFKRMMRKSGLYEMEEAKFLRQAVMDSFKEDKGNLEKNCDMQSFRDKHILALAASLQQEMLKAYENCCRSLELTYGGGISKGKIKQLLLEHYAAAGTVSLFWPSLQNEVAAVYTL